MRPIDADALKTRINTVFFSEIGQIIDEAPTVNEWIPCSDRLPKTGDSILVTYSDGEVGIVWDARPEVWGAYEKATNLIFPIAWMPLPESYKKDGEV